MKDAFSPRQVRETGAAAPYSVRGGAVKPARLLADCRLQRFEGVERGALGLVRLAEDPHVRLVQPLRAQPPALVAKPQVLAGACHERLLLARDAVQRIEADANRLELRPDRSLDHRRE